MPEVMIVFLRRFRNATFAGKLYANEKTAMPKELHIGNLLAVTASIHSFEKPGNPGQFDEYKYNTELGITAQGFAGKIEIKKNLTVLEY